MSKFKLTALIALKSLISSIVAMSISLYLMLLYLPRPSIFHVAKNPNPPILWPRVFICWIVIILLIVAINSLVKRFIKKDSSSSETLEKPIISAWIMFTLIAIPTALLTMRVANHFSPSLHGHVSYHLSEAVNFNDSPTLLWLLTIADGPQTQQLLGQAMQANSDSCLRILFAVGIRPKKETLPSLMLQAAAAGNNNLIKLLAEEKIPINFQSPYGQTPLSAAVEQNQSKTVEFLLASGADIKLSPKDSYPLLVVALLNENITIMNTLIKAGVDVKGCKLEKEFSLVRKDSPDKTNPQFIKLSPDCSILLLAAASANVEATKLLIAAGVDVNQTSSSNLTALMCAKASLCNECEQALVAAGAK